MTVQVTWCSGAYRLVGGGWVCVLSLIVVAILFFVIARLHRIISPLLLGVLFFPPFVPIGLVMRAIRKNPLRPESILRLVALGS